MYVNQLPNILLALIAGQRRVGPVGIELGRSAGRELLADVSKLLLHSLHLLVLRLGIAKVRDEVLQPSCLGRHDCRRRCAAASAAFQINVVWPTSRPYPISAEPVHRMCLLGYLEVRPDVATPVR